MRGGPYCVKASLVGFVPFLHHKLMKLPIGLESRPIEPASQIPWQVKVTESWLHVIRQLGN